MATSPPTRQDRLRHGAKLASAKRSDRLQQRATRVAAAIKANYLLSVRAR